jgi:Domain of unknown function (DUF5664)
VVDEKKCIECGEVKPIEKFRLYGGGKRQNKCKKCQYGVSNKWRYSHKEGVNKSAKLRAIVNPLSSSWCSGRGQAKKKGLEWTISLEEFSSLRSKPCYYCGGELPLRGSGLDRLDNSWGYRSGNVVPCCTSCNRVRGDYLTPEEMRVAMQAVKHLRLVNSGTNPKDKLGASKIPLSLVPPIATLHTAAAMYIGAQRYGAYNFRQTKVLASIYIDAAFRHLTSWLEGEECASDSGVNHLGHASACIAILLDAKEHGCLIDDRTPPSSEGKHAYQGVLERMNDFVKAQSKQ